MFALSTIIFAIIKWLFVATGLQDDLASLAATITAGYALLAAAADIFWRCFLLPTFIYSALLATVAQLWFALFAAQTIYRHLDESGFLSKCKFKYYAVRWAVRRATPRPAALLILSLLLLLATDVAHRRITRPVVQYDREFTERVWPQGITYHVTTYNAAGEIVPEGAVPTARVEAEEVVGVVAGPKTLRTCDEWQRGLMVWCETCLQEHVC